MKKEFLDQIGKSIYLSIPPERIISLVPSLTELLFDIGMGDKVVGVTKFCVHPREKTKSITKVGGTKDFDISIVRLLKPDLIIASKEENVKERIEILSEEIPIYVSDVKNLNDAIEMITVLGIMCDKEKESPNYLYNNN